ncbi:MAG: hypothetical protein J6B75_06130 [Ruminococcus sp.]|nr:hypothetical protein [Ruminococcus sp.]
MNKNDKDLMDKLNDLEDFSVEEIAEKYPAIDKKTRKRILKQCMKKNAFSAGSDHEVKEAITVSGTERYKRRNLYRFAASAAAFVIAVGGITSVFMLNRNPNGNISSESEKPPAASFYDKSSDAASESSSTSTNSTEAVYDHDTSNTLPADDNVSDGFGYLGTTENDTPQPTIEATEPTTDNTVSFDNVALNETCWSEGEIDGPDEHRIEFGKDGFSGHYITPPYDYTTQDALQVYFTYTQNGDEISIRMGSNKATGKVSFSDDRNQVMLTIVWADGRTDHFYTYSIEINSDGSLEYYLPSDSDYNSQPTTTENNLVSLNGTTWYESELDGTFENSIMFGNDGCNGHYIIPPEDYATTDPTLIYFSYMQNGNEILISMGSDTATGKLSSADNDPRGQVMMTLVWANGDTEYLYTEDISVTDLQN